MGRPAAAAAAVVDNQRDRQVLAVGVGTQAVAGVGSLLQAVAGVGSPLKAAAVGSLAAAGQGSPELVVEEGMQPVVEGGSPAAEDTLGLAEDSLVAKVWERKRERRNK